MNLSEISSGTKWHGKHTESVLYDAPLEQRPEKERPEHRSKFIHGLVDASRPVLPSTTESVDTRISAGVEGPKPMPADRTAVRALRNRMWPRMVLTEIRPPARCPGIRMCASSTIRTIRKSSYFTSVLASSPWPAGARSAAAIVLA